MIWSGSIATKGGHYPEENGPSAIRTIMAAALALAVTLPAAHAAARDRVFVASYGSDTNPCTFGSPCKTFQHAHDVVATSGEITAIDSAGFGPLTITKGVTVTSPNGVEAGIAAAAGGTAITINATAADAVILRGLTLEGTNAAWYGIQANSAGKIEITDSVVRDFATTGIVFTATTVMLIHVSNTKVMNNNVGIAVKNNVADTGNLFANFDHLTIIDNNQNGFLFTSTSNQSGFIDIQNSNIENNGLYANNGCEVEMTGSYVQMLNTTLGNTFDQFCSVRMDDSNLLGVSHVVGGSVLQGNNTDNYVQSDGTNLLAFQLCAQHLMGTELNSQSREAQQMPNEGRALPRR